MVNNHINFRLLLVQIYLLKLLISKRGEKDQSRKTGLELFGCLVWLRLQVTNSLTGVERYKSDTVCIELDRSNNEPRGGGTMSENERNYSAYLQNAINSAAPIARFSSFARSTPSISTYTILVFSRCSISRR